MIELVKTLDNPSKLALTCAAMVIVLSLVLATVLSYTSSHLASSLMVREQFTSLILNGGCDPMWVEEIAK